MRKETISEVEFITLEQSVIDVTNAARVRDEVREVSTTTRRLALDMSKVGFVDSSGLGEIVAIVRDIRKRGGAVVICCAQQSVQVLFKMVMLTQIVPICDTRDDALRAIGDAS